MNAAAPDARRRGAAELRDYRNEVIEILADREASLLAQVAELESERDIWKLVAFQSLHHAHAMIAQHTRSRDLLRARVFSLLAEIRMEREIGRQREVQRTSDAA